MQKATNAEFKRRFLIAAKTAKWAVTMAKVRIRQATALKSWPRWHFIDFCGPDGAESRGVVDMIAIRKDHSERSARKSGTKRGDVLQIVLIQVKGGSAAEPTPDDAHRLRNVARHHHACGVLLGTWKRGKAVRFFSLDSKKAWAEVPDLHAIFR